MIYNLRWRNKIYDTINTVLSYTPAYFFGYVLYEQFTICISYNFLCVKIPKHSVAL